MAATDTAAMAATDATTDATTDAVSSASDVQCQGSGSQHNNK
jgi:hypothetical protein